MQTDLGIALGGLLGGTVIGLTGMGGGAVITPLLVLGFGVPPTTAVSSDIVASLFMKPVGALVHQRRGTVDKTLVLWLALGSVPSALLGAWLFHRFGLLPNVEWLFHHLLAGALVTAAMGMIAKAVVQRRRGHRPTDAPVVLHRASTVLIGVLGGLVVGMTSVGAGSLMIVLLLLTYPTLSAARLVGTDLAQAIPLVAAASLGHLLFGEVSLGVTSSLLLGGLPGVYLGARYSSRAPDHVIRPLLVLVLVASALKLAGIGLLPLCLVLALTGAISIPVFAVRRVASDETPS